ncbi:MAG: hypothetical protein KAY24_06185 [Candidatus Eisenbacteria sp.]|nr:hypothetical protein [Candidatus Eisenbacteria bacterium]
MKQLAVFFRAFNDLDHLTPIVHRFCESPGHRVHLFCMNPVFDFADNHNIRFLESEHGLSAGYLHDELTNIGLSTRFWRLLFKFSNTKALAGQPYSTAGKIRWRIRQIFALKLLAKLGASRGWVAPFFDRVKPSALIFDWVSDAFGLNRMITELAQTRGIPTFSLPHGMNLYTNHDCSRGQSETAAAPSYSYDYILSQGELCRSHLEHKRIPSEKIIDMGSIRFCREWMASYRDHVVEWGHDLPESGDRLRVVFFLSKLQYNVKEELLLETIEVLARDGEIHLVLKPHTRGRGAAFANELVEKYRIDVRPELSSVVLSDWADVGIVYGSSIGLQILFDQKLLIYPYYVDSNESYYDKMKACWRVDSIDELQRAMDRVKKDRSYRPYSEEDVQNLFRGNVYAGDLGRDVVEAYFRFIAERSI